MIPAIEHRTNELKSLCVRYAVDRLYLFGSAATGSADPAQSDFDFLVEFQPSTRDSYADSYFGLLDELTTLLERPVDLIVESSIKNPYFLESVKRTRTPIYGA